MREHHGDPPREGVARPQRYELTACECLGADFQDVLAAVRWALIGLLRDFPDLPELTLMDDTATANAETRKWLQTGGFLLLNR